MQNQLLRSLLNLLNKKSQKINLITQDFKHNTGYSETEEKSNNLLIVILGTLSTILILLTALNYQNNKELNERFYTLKNQLLSQGISKISDSDLEQRITKLENYKNLNFKKNKINKFFAFLATLNNFFINQGKVIDINYKENKNTFEYEFIVNTSKASFETDFNLFFKQNFPRDKIEKVSETKIEKDNLKQFKFTGNYENK